MGLWKAWENFMITSPARDFDNFQFVNFTEMMSRDMDQSQKEAEFSLAGLMKLPSQYRKILELNLLGSTSVSRGIPIHRVPLPPTYAYFSFFQEPLIWSSLILSAPSSDGDHTVCTICYTSPEDMAFGCGHQICCACGVRRVMPLLSAFY
ncbi:hypothetical protein I3843_11G014600 [Carya illinoinensis]|nr:hypothetical protein I3843_11G014600 [Carya illinoinensis]